jgi:hypothetical protein
MRQLKKAAVLHDFAAVQSTAKANFGPEEDELRHTSLCALACITHKAWTAVLFDAACTSSN